MLPTKSEGEGKYSSNDPIEMMLIIELFPKGVRRSKIANKDELKTVIKVVHSENALTMMPFEIV